MRILIAVLAVVSALSSCAKRSVPKEAETVKANADAYIARMNASEAKIGSDWRVELVHCMGDTDVPADGYGTCTIAYSRPCMVTEASCRVEWLNLQCSTTPDAGCKPRGR